MLRFAVSAVFASFAAAVLCGGAQAQTKSACDAFDWPITRERTLFAAQGAAPVPSGAKIDGPGTGLTLELKPNDAVPFPLPPARQPKSPGSFGGVVSFANVPKAGLYQVTLGSEAWIDAIQNGKAVDSKAHSGKRGCEEVRKSVRFELESGALTIQLSGAAGDTIKLAVLPAE
jgi:hypothetical protein